FRRQARVLGGRLRVGDPDDVVGSRLRNVLQLHRFDRCRCGSVLPVGGYGAALAAGVRARGIRPGGTVAGHARNQHHRDACALQIPLLHRSAPAHWARPYRRRRDARMQAEGLPVSALWQQSAQFRVGQVAPLADLEPAELDVADAHPHQLLDPVTEVGGHQADLAVESLHQHDPEPEPAQLAGLARQGGLSVHRHALGHRAQELGGDLVVDRDQVFLLELVLGAQDLVDDVAVTGQQDQPLGILVEPPDREDPPVMAHEVDDVVLDPGFGGADHADRFVERDVDVLLLALGDGAGPQRLAVDPYLVTLAHLRTDPAPDAVDGHPAFGNQAVGLATGAEAGFADVFVEAHAGPGARGAHRLAQAPPVGEYGPRVGAAAQPSRSPYSGWRSTQPAA